MLARRTPVLKSRGRVPGNSKVNARMLHYATRVGEPVANLCLVLTWVPWCALQQETRLTVGRRAKTFLILSTHAHAQARARAHTHTHTQLHTLNRPGAVFNGPTIVVQPSPACAGNSDQPDQYDCFVCRHKATAVWQAASGTRMRPKLCHAMRQLH